MKKNHNRHINALSLFANVGIAETYLNKANINVVVANEIDSQRAKFYKHLYPNTNMIEGDITNQKIFDSIIQSSIENNVDLVMATPPCQGMSTAGKKDKKDERNSLIKYAVKAVNKIKPSFVFFENVPQQLQTPIFYRNKEVTILEYIEKELGKNYVINNQHIVNCSDYGVPQMRQRAIFLMVRKDLDFYWNFPEKNNKIITLENVLGNLPSLDPYITDISYKDLINLFPEYEAKKENGLKVSKWHYPPEHIYRQVFSMMHTPSGKTAFDNIDKFKPKKSDGSFVKGFKNTYKRQDWNKPAYTITMYNRTIGSQDNVHPGRYVGKDDEGYDIYSDARVLTIYELLIVSSLPKDWNIPDWASDHFIRQVIGEGIPPLMVLKIMKELKYA